MSKENEAEAHDAMLKAKSLIEQKDYKGARTWMKTAMNLFPDFKDVLSMLILCETLYYGELQFPNWGIDWYSVLHLHPSVTDSEVNTQCQILITCTSLMELERFPGAVDALELLNRAKSVLCDQSKRLEYDLKREDSGLIDFLGSDRKELFKEDYLNWKPPIYNSDGSNVSERSQIQSLKRSRISFPEWVVDGEALSLFSNLKKVKYKLFDEMSQRPHYAPLEKYNRNLREGMMIGLDLAFIKLCEDILKLEDPRSFWSRLDEFMEELTQLEEMGYNVEKLRERLETLKGIAKRDQETLDALEKFEVEVRGHETKIGELQSRILELEAQIGESRVLMDKKIRKIDVLKKDSTEVVQEFASAVKSKWNGSEA